MGSTYTQDNGLEKMANGDQINTWGLTVNNNWDLVDQSLDGYSSIALTGDTVLTMPQGQLASPRNRVIVFTGTLGGATSVTMPSGITKGWMLTNSTNVTLTIKQLVNGNPNSTLDIAPGNTAYVTADANGNVLNGFRTLQLVSCRVSGSPTFLQDINVNGSVNAAAATFTGTVNINTLGVTGSITAGAVTAGSIGSTGQIHGATLLADGAMTCVDAFITTAYLSNGVTTPYLHLTGILDGATNGTFSGQVAAATMVVGGNDVWSNIVAAKTIGNNINTNGPSNNNGSKVISAVRGESGWTIFTFGTIAGSRWEIAYGSGTAADNAVIPLPSGFVSSQAAMIASINHLDSNANTTGVIDCSISPSMVMTCRGHDDSSHTWTGTGNWLGLVYRNGV